MCSKYIHRIIAQRNIWRHTELSFSHRRFTFHCTPYDESFGNIYFDDNYNEHLLGTYVSQAFAEWLHHHV